MTSSVEMAGVLLVFSFLIVPAICGVVLAKEIGQRLAVGWGIGVFTSALGVAGSYFLDLPTGAAVVVCFGLVLLAVGLTRLLPRRA
ncbi:MAG: metal ABC transporter permease [Candidatus Omnitrophica bacterium]|nr:metal ABC transporter permease [Candidatus Omnitrophota bacterium]